jgi:hypothetical protein
MSLQSTDIEKTSLKDSKWYEKLRKIEKDDPEPVPAILGSTKRFAKKLGILEQFPKDFRIIDWFPFSVIDEYYGPEEKAMAKHVSVVLEAFWKRRYPAAKIISLGDYLGEEKAYRSDPIAMVVYKSGPRPSKKFAEALWEAMDYCGGS